MRPINQKALKTLGYDKIINQFTEYAASPLRRTFCQGLSSSSDLEEVRTWQAQTMGAVTRIRLKDSTSLSGTRDIRNSLKCLDIGSSLSTPELFSISSLLTVAARTKAYRRHDVDEDGRETGESQDDFDSFESSLVGLEPLTPPNSKVKRCILSEDEVADDASPRLSHVRRSIKVTADRIHTQLSSIPSSNRSCLQDTVITIKNGRYCLPVELEYKNQVLGIVHDQSVADSTLLIELMAITRLNNEVRELEIQEQKEVEAVLVSPSNQTAPYTEEFRMDMELLAQLNLIFTKVDLARHYKCSVPMFNDKGCIHIKSRHHPLLNLQFAVPISVWLGREFSLLIVTGPNTGSKTVSLETVGLFALMGQSGFHISAWEGSGLAMFDQVFANVGDKQSIEQSLSTFPTHMTNIVRILSEADSRSLCLFDKLGVGTDPTEEVTLAIAILSFLHNMKYRTMATAHYNGLRVFVLNMPEVESACCEFNMGTLQPTHQLLTGIPGKSNASTISQRLGLSRYITDDAKSRLEAKDESSKDLLISLESNRLTIEKEQVKINAYRDEIASLKAHLTQKEKRLDECKGKILESATEEAQRIPREAKEMADQTIKRISKLAVSSGMDRELKTERARLRNQPKKTDEKLAVKSKGPSQPTSPERLKIGNGVKVLSMNLKGTVDMLPNAKGDLYIQMGILRSLMSTRDLELPNEKDISATLSDGSSMNYGGKTAKGRGSGSSQIKVSKPSTVSAEVNLIGMTMDEAMPAMEKYLDGAYLTYLQMVRVVYDRRTGALKSVVRKRLRQLKYVKKLRLDQSGGGNSDVTVMAFK